MRRKGSSGAAAKQGAEEELDLKALALLTCDRLREELRRRQLPVKGKKAALVERLEKSLRSGSAVVEMSSGDSGKVKRRQQPSTFGSPLLQANGAGSSSSALQERLQERQLEQKTRESIVLWRRPLTTLHYFARELVLDLRSHGRSLLTHRKAVATFLVTAALVAIAYGTPGPHQKLIATAQERVMWWAYWVGLGILSSVGLGTGLHTFLLYLGPHIASVTMAAYECGSLDFPEPPYPNEILCPETAANPALVSLWTIMAKVRVEAFMWGAGTALGELPPYFMARAARLSGAGGGAVVKKTRAAEGGGDYEEAPEDEESEDEELREFEELQRKKEKPEDMTWLDQAKLSIERLVERVGFMGIMLCASIPNPLFDLAGITCGHFLIPFWTFFGATLVGKAVVKMHLQKLCVIIAFSETLLEKLLAALARLPLVGHRLQAPFRQFLQEQKAKLHRKSGAPIPSEGSLLAAIFEKVVVLMIAYFVVSIVNSLAQSYHKRLSREERRRKRAKVKLSSD